MCPDTIVALATPPGRGSIGIIRLSGSLAKTIALRLNGNKILLEKVATYCSFKDKQAEVIDMGLAIYFKAPHSFTGEDVVEMQIHGAPITLDKLIKECLHLGARLARPGEFSERAFLNGKIDLTQAEAISDLIQASSQTAARLAVCSLQGKFSKKIEMLNEQLIELRLYVEASIDFPEEEVDFLSDGKIAEKLNIILEDLSQIRSNATQGAILREGFSLAIVGKPNVGKSTLINCLTGRDVAIVTEIAGTTRDVIKENILLDDIPLRLIDTAGLRESNDLVEQEGIRRAKQEINQADCILLVKDINQSSNSNSNLENDFYGLPEGIPIIKIFNKIDSVNLQPKIDEEEIYLSAKQEIGIDLLKATIKNKLGYQPNEGQFLARRRHLEALNKTYELLSAGQNQLISRAGELLAEDLRLAHQSLSEITGEFTSDDLLGKIFSSFCIGK